MLKARGPVPGSRGNSREVEDAAGLYVAGLYHQIGGIADDQGLVLLEMYVRGEAVSDILVQCEKT